MAKRIYLAGPEVFLPDPLAQAARKKALCAEFGYEGVFPMDTVLEFEGLHDRARALLIYRSDVALMNGCDICVANMTPFRGPSMDVGTAYEMGWMGAQGKPVLGYTNAGGDITERTGAMFGGRDRLRARANGTLEDPEGLMIEGFGMVDNLMLDGGVIGAGFEVVVSPVPPAERYTDLAGFRRCLEQLRAKGS
jgi:nucleoside 2-deoxyribosyltransferase